MSQLRLIAGSGRSGTTWVLDAIAAANGLRPVFEPLNPYASRVGRLYAHRMLRPDSSHPELKRFLDAVFAGQSARLWTKYRRQWRWLVPRKEDFRFAHTGQSVVNRWARFAREAPALARMSSVREPLVKCIWSNFLLGWLARHYDCRILFLVRHPGAVIESELRNKWNAGFALDRLRVDVRFHESTAYRYRALLNRQLSDVERLAVLWLIENQWNLEQASVLPMTIVHYEHLPSYANSTWVHVCRALSVPNIPDARILGRPSQQSAPRDSVAALGAAEQARWSSSLSSEQRARIQAILDASKFDIYSMDTLLPRFDRAYSSESASARLMQ